MELGVKQNLKKGGKGNNYIVFDETLEIKQLKKHITEKAILSDEEVLWLFRKHHDRRTDKDIENLVNSNLALVYSLTVQYSTKHQNIDPEFNVPFMDLFNSGVIGLYKAIKKFDSIRELKFSTYAYFWISAEIRTEITKQIYPIKKYSYNTIHRAPIDDLDSKTIEDKQTKMNMDDIINSIKKILNHKQWLIFTDFFLKELSVNEISLKDKIPTTTIYYTINRIKKLVMSELPDLKKYLIKK